MPDDRSPLRHDQGVAAYDQGKAEAHDLLRGAGVWVVYVVRELGDGNVEAEWLAGMAPGFLISEAHGNAEWLAGMAPGFLISEAHGNASPGLAAEGAGAGQSPGAADSHRATAAGSLSAFRGSEGL